ncbi:uncharacterized protein DS421_9g273960 [Arachis hypogaea]|nr:uncharacterized protein DS421_9g273960 [Arachis hypogaea]
MNQVTNPPFFPQSFVTPWRILKQRKNPSPSSPPPFPGPQRRRRLQVLSITASSSSPCPEPSSSARRLHLLWLLGTEPRLVASRLHLH